LHNRGCGFHPPCPSQLSNILNTKSSNLWPIDTIGSAALINPRIDRGLLPAPEELVSFVPMASVSENTGNIKEKIKRPLNEVTKGYTSFRVNDVLFAKITPCMENGKVAVATDLEHGIGFGSTEFHVLRARDGILPSYLWYFMRNPDFRVAMKSKMVGAGGQRRVPAEAISSFLIPLPPLSEQHRIVEILDQADALRRQRREADELFKRILPALFQEMFGDPNRNDRNWPTDDFEATFEDVSRLGNKIPRSEYLPEGDLPVMAQEQEEVAGFWNNQSDKFCGNLPVILFGDHTRIFKLIER
jgi:type I restriction enzyme S subunit